METTWFCLIALMLAIYVTLDGFDLGAGIVHFLVARTDAERRVVFRSIGPVWDGNEVWLLAGGGTLYFAFPVLYAASFSGFYLPLMVVLWLLILRGISIEFRNHVRSLVWQPFWDAVFCGSSALLAIFFGAALGNVVRGVPLDGSADFFLPLWTDFTTGRDAGILDWYTVLIAVAALLSLAMHGALWIAHKTEGALSGRARVLAGRLWWGVAVSVALITAASFGVQPHLRQSFDARPWAYAVPLAALAGLFGARWLRRGLARFLASCAFLVAMLGSAAVGLYPNVLPSNSDPALSLTIYNSAAAPYGLHIGFFWFVPGMLLTTGYFVYTYRNFAGKLKMEEEGY
jgi:cytochrome bd ubiquinol oxidase subunit II